MNPADPPALAPAQKDDKEESRRAATLPLQPVPLSVKVSEELHADGWSTTVARLWRPGDGERCRLCPKSVCGLDAFGLCQVSYPVHIEGDPALFSMPESAWGIDAPGLRVNRAAD